MGEKMTLGKVRSTLDEWGCSSLGQVQISTDLLRKMRDAIDAHLATPAQTVDTEAVREVIANLRRESALLAHDMDSQTYLLEQADKLSQAIGDKT